MQRARTVTLLFTDIESSMRLLEPVGEVYPQVRERHRAILSASAETYGGAFCVYTPDPVHPIRWAL